MKHKVFLIAAAALVASILFFASGCTNPFMEKILRNESGNEESSNGKGQGIYCTVTFHSNGGSPIARSMVPRGHAISRPAMPRLTGFGFDGWFTDDEAFSSEWDFDDPVNGDLHLYAKWIAGLAVRFSSIPSEPLTPLNFIHGEPIDVLVEVNGFLDSGDLEFTVIDMLAGGNLSLTGPIPQSTVVVNGVMEYIVKVNIASETTAFPSGTGRIDIIGFSDLPPGYPPYSGQVKNALVNVMDGQAAARPIPVTQGNIERFRDYASDPYLAGRGRYYRLTEDIALTGVWNPIASVTYPFTGNFDGGGYSISGLSINRNFLNIAMFAFIASSGVVKNFALSDVDITGTGYVGGIAGVNEGIIRNCSVTGIINGDNHLGGIAGRNWGRVENCFTSCEITGINIYIGGIVGENVGGTVQCCYSEGNTQGNSDSGGIVGNNEGGTIINCYSLGNVASTVNNSGGIAGYNLSDGVVRSCYAKGEVSGNNGVGGIVGIVSDASFVNDCVALNRNITALSGYGRTVGDYSDSNISPTYAQDNMYLNGSPWTPTLSLNNDGLSASQENYRDPDWWRGAGIYSDSSLWKYSWDFGSAWGWDYSGQCPILKNCGPQRE